MSDLGVFLDVSHPKRIKRNYSVTKQTYGNVCVYCGGVGDTIDHVLPHTLYVDHSRANLVTACRSCNSIAGDRVFESFDAKRDFIRQRRIELDYPVIPDKQDLQAYDDDDSGEPWIIDAIWEELDESDFPDNPDLDPKPALPAHKVQVWIECGLLTGSGKGCKLDISYCPFHR
jgi:hypothetical protein